MNFGKPRKPRHDGVLWPERLERNVRIVELFADGKTTREIAEEMDMTYTNVSVVLADAGVDTRLWSDRAYARMGLERQKLERNAAIRQARERGETLQAIAERYRVSHQRISQIIAAPCSSEARSGK